MAVIFAVWAGILIDAMGFRWGLAITAAAALAGIAIIREEYRHERN